jgi:hypothetical protein
VGEVHFPQVGREEMDLKGGMGVDPLEQIHEIDIRVDALQPARGDEALHDADIACADFGPAKQPSLSTSTWYG